MTYFKFFTQNSAPNQSAGYNALNDAADHTLPIPPITMPLKSIYNHLKTQSTASYLQKFFGRRIGDKGYCRTWALTDTLSASIGSAFGFIAGLFILSIRHRTEDGLASLGAYNNQVQNNNLTCNAMFDQGEDQTCLNLSPSYLPNNDTISQICSGTIDFYTNYSAYINQCRLILNDCCRKGDSALAIATGFLILATTTIFIRQFYQHHAETSANNLRLTAEHDEILSKTGIMVSKKESQLSLMKKIEPLLHLETAMQEQLATIFPTVLLGEINRFYGLGP